MSSTELQNLEKHGSSHSSYDVENEETDDVRVQFIQPTKPSDSKEKSNDKDEFRGLTKEELMKYAKDPFWRKVRIVFMVLFWVIWVALIVASVLIIVFTPKCPPVPKRGFWQKSSGYHVDVVNFKDSNGDGFGDIKGLTSKLDYLKSKCNHLILSSIIKGSFGTKDVRSPAVTDFKKIDEKVGTMDDVKKFVKMIKNKQLKAIIEFPVHTGKDHPWFKKAAKGDKTFQKYYIWSTKSDSKMVNRVGKPVWNKVGSEFYWSSLHESSPALNLNNSKVLAALKDAVAFWLSEGFSGVFLDDVAFLAPEVKTADVGPGLSVSTLKTGDLKKWYGAGHRGQLLTAGAVKFVTVVRSWVEEVQKAAGREFCLIAGPGNTGLQNDHNRTLALLGTEASAGAHLVVASNLVPGQGAKVLIAGPDPSLRSTIDLVLQAPKGRVALMTQTLAGPRSTDATRTFLNLLLPTTAFTVFGEELGMKGYGVDLSSPKKAPGPAYSFLTAAALKDKNAYKQDLFDAFDVPMQWTSDGGFSPKITYKNQENVMMLSTLGRPGTRLKTFNSLVKLREEPSLNWGELKWVESQEKTEPHHYIFSRAATGFPKFLVVIIRGTTGKGGLVRDLSSVCAKASPQVASPMATDFKTKEALPLNNMFFRYDPVGSVFVFKCT